MKFLSVLILLGLFLLECAAQTPVNQIGLVKNDPAPNIITLDNHGNPFLLSSKLKQGPVVVVFYSGLWCKPCSDELKELQTVYSKFLEQEVTLMGITSELPDVIEQINKTLGITFPMVHDRSHLIMDAYKTSISYNTTAGNLPVEDSNMIHKYAGEKDYTLTFTAVYVIGRGGKEGKDRIIYYADVNPNFKPNAKATELLAAIEEVKKVHALFPVKKDEEKHK